MNVYLSFHHAIIGLMSKIHSCYWLETELFLNHNHFFPEVNNSVTNLHLCNKPTQCPSLFTTYKEAFNIHTSQPKPLQLPQDEQNNRFSTHFSSGKVVQDQENSSSQLYMSLINLPPLIMKLVLLQKLIILSITCSKSGPLLN